MVRRAGGTFSALESGALCRPVSFGSLSVRPIVERCRVYLTLRRRRCCAQGRDERRAPATVWFISRDDGCFPFFLVRGEYLGSRQMVKVVLCLYNVTLSLVGHKAERDAFR